MIGSCVLGTSMFWISDSMYSAAFNVLIKISTSTFINLKNQHPKHNCVVKMGSPNLGIRCEILKLNGELTLGGGGGGGGREGGISFFWILIIFLFFINFLIIHSNPHVTSTLFFISDKVSKPPTPLLRGLNPPKVTPHLVNLLVAITN